MGPQTPVFSSYCPGRSLLEAVNDTCNNQDGASDSCDSTVAGTATPPGLPSPRGTPEMVPPSPPGIPMPFREGMSPHPTSPGQSTPPSSRPATPPGLVSPAPTSFQAPPGLTLPAGVEQPVLGSVGSAGHDQGLCRPCGFFHHKNGCAAGTSCTFCHLCPAGAIERQRKLKRQLLRSMRNNGESQCCKESPKPAAAAACGASRLPLVQDDTTQCSRAEVNSTHGDEWNALRNCETGRHETQGKQAQWPNKALSQSTPRTGGTGSEMTSFAKARVPGLVDSRYLANFGHHCMGFSL